MKQKINCKKCKQEKEWNTFYKWDKGVCPLCDEEKTYDKRVNDLFKKTEG